MVRVKGLEPPWNNPLDPKSSASTNFATSALEPIRREMSGTAISASIVDAKVKTYFNFSQIAKKIFPKNFKKII